jgi:hypothetical protein
LGVGPSGAMGARLPELPARRFLRRVEVCQPDSLSASVSEARPRCGLGIAAGLAWRKGRPKEGAWGAWPRCTREPAKLSCVALARSTTR